MFSLRSSIGIHARTLSKSLRNTHINIRFQSTGTGARKITESEIEIAKSMNWAEFFALRKKQRHASLIGSVVSAVVFTGAAWGYLAQKEIDPTETELFFGLDQFTLYIGGIMCAGGLGFLLGPALVGDPLFIMMNRGKLGAFKAKYKIFSRHIINKRVDASSQSVSNPVPDYYGEKIGSLKDYRQWLRDCNTYRRKAREFL